MEIKKENFRELIRGMAVYTSASILGPIIVFGGIGWMIDRKMETGPLWMLIFIGIAFVFTNVLLFFKIRKMMSVMEKIGEEVKSKKDNKKF